MSVEIVVTVSIFVLGGIFSVVWFLLRQKDAHQEEQIKLLFKKHDEDADALNALRIQIAENHYHKAELDYRFAQLNDTFRDVGARLEKKFDALQDSFVKYMSKQAGQ